MLKAINIMWDVDDKKDLKHLPAEIIIPEGMTDEEEISDYISDETGFCHCGFELLDDAENSLINTIKEDCQHWENLEQNKFYNYMYLNECKNSKENGLYQLILNGKELWYGTLAEINAVVKTMIMRIERDFTL